VAPTPVTKGQLTGNAGINSTLEPSTFSQDGVLQEGRTGEEKARDDIG
jgi:hypothetical protein